LQLEFLVLQLTMQAEKISSEAERLRREVETCKSR
jgi:hypothetical protein